MLGYQEGSRMELSFMNKEEENHSAIDKPVEPRQEGTAPISTHAEAGGGTTASRLDPDARITETIIWNSSNKQTGKKPRCGSSSTGPTWGHLLGQIIIGVIEILIPLAFIISMIYWRAPWLFWAVVHFLRGEPIFNF
jgi:hypothetical protein